MAVQSVRGQVSETPGNILPGVVFSVLAWSVGMVGPSAPRAPYDRHRTAPIFGYM